MRHALWMLLGASSAPYHGGMPPVPAPTPAHDAPREVIAAVGDRIAQHLRDVLSRWDFSTDEGVGGTLEARARKFK